MNKKPNSRLNLPEALNGPFTGITIATYGIELAFLERFLLPRLARQITNRVLLVDSLQLHRSIATGRGYRRLNRTYATAPVHSKRAFHPKFLLLTGPKSGRLLVGSGNASVSGYTGAGEAFTQYDWTPESTGDMAAFTTIREFLHGLRQGLGIDDFAWRLIEDQLSVAEWLTGKPDVSPVVHNIHESLLDQLANHVGSEKVIELVTYAPFHDRGARAMKALLQKLRPTCLTLLVQPRQTTLDLPALTSVTRSLGDAFKVKAIDAPDPYSKVFLHAKFILVRTAHRDFLLQGSPNLSARALCESSAQGNVEMASLLSGPQGAFDAFLSAVTTSPLMNGLLDVTPVAWSDETPTDASVWLLRNLTWVAPDLSGTISRIVQAPDIRVFAFERLLIPTSVTVNIEDDTSQFTMTFGLDDTELLNQAERINIQIQDGAPIPAYPYRVNELLRLSNAGHRIDLLREAGSLDLEDKEIIEILQELDRIMIIDGLSLWRLAHPNNAQQDTDDDANPDGPKISYDEIDWDLIKAHPIYKGYSASRTNINTVSATELAILLSSLTGRFRIDAGAPGAAVSEAAKDLSVEPDLEDADALDDERAGDEDAEPTRQNASTRVKSLWRSFVKRYVRGLSDQRFVEQVGPGIVIPSYVAFNHLCRRLRITGLIDPDFLTNAQTRLWSFMWGSMDSPGYLANLPIEERRVALDVMAQHEDIPATLAAIDDTYWHAWDQDEDLRPLRDVVRAFLVNREWSIDQAGLQCAANAASASSIDSAEALLEEIWQLAVYSPEVDVDRDIADSLGLKFTDLRWNKEIIMRHGIPRGHKVLRLPDDFDLTAQRVAALFATWMNLDPGNDYLRVVAGRTIAIWEVEKDGGLLFNRDTGDDVMIDLAETDQEPWLQRVDELSQILAT